MNENLTLDDMLDNLDRKRVKGGQNNSSNGQMPVIRQSVSTGLSPQMRHTLLGIQPAVEVPELNEPILSNKNSFLEEQVNLSEKAFRNGPIQVINVKKMKTIRKSASQISKRSFSAPINSCMNLGNPIENGNNFRRSNLSILGHERGHSMSRISKTRSHVSDRSSIENSGQKPDLHHKPVIPQVKNHSHRRESTSCNRSIHSNRTSRRGSILNAYGSSTIDKEHSHAIGLERRRQSIIGKIIKNVPDVDDTTYDDSACIEEQNKAALEDIEPVIDDVQSNFGNFEENDELEQQQSESMIYHDNLDETKNVSSAEYVSDFPEENQKILLSSKLSKSSYGSSHNALKSISKPKMASRKSSKSSYQSNTFQSNKNSSNLTLVDRAKSLARQVRQEFDQNFNGEKQEDLVQGQNSRLLFGCCGVEVLRMGKRKGGSRVNEDPRMEDV